MDAVPAKSFTQARSSCLSCALRTTSSWKTRALAFCAAALLMAAPAWAGIHPVTENGHTVWVNDDVTPQVKPIENVPAPRHFVYWSVIEHRWKPVAVPSAHALRAARSAAAEVTSYVEAQPKVAESASVKKSAAKNAKGKSNPTSWGYDSLTSGHLVTSAEVDKAITDAAQRHGVDANLVRAVVQIESGFNPQAVSRKGAMGLMQLMPGTARQLNVTNPLDPAQNVDAGVRHLKGLLDSYKGDISLSLAAYNAGAGAVARNGNTVPPYAETREYVRRITTIYGSNTLRTLGTFSAPLRIERDEHGTLRISNTD